MIYLTRLNEKALVVNCEQIEFIEATPNTVISMTTGRKIVVSESIDEVIVKVVEYKRKVFGQGNPIIKYQGNEV
ncbi:flagellar FlbD family protein [Wukongibacter baidiensis]|uniref:flagellar FlbD family protein n=1 Tax=Wukongibacter baidiensis TaxID=1723361 RepID=UPI003D7F3F89